MIFEIDQNFKITGAVIINPYINPLVVYKEYLSRDFVDEIANKIIINNMQFIFSIFSNESSNSIVDYANESMENLSSLHKQTLEVFKSAEGEISEADYRFLEEIIKGDFKEQSIVSSK